MKKAQWCSAVSLRLMSGVGQALVVFIPIYWAWVGMTMHANLHDVDQTRTRLGRVHRRVARMTLSHFLTVHSSGAAGRLPWVTPVESMW
jgi:low temperature requirement protein LtrA